MMNRNYSITASISYDIPDEKQAQIVPRKICKKEPIPCAIRGSENYYIFRFNDFIQRHKGCKHIPPDYYYGPLKSEIEVKTKVKELQNKDYAIALRFPIPIVGSLNATLVTTIVNPQNISNGRELWIGLEDELVKRLAKVLPVVVNDQHMLPDILASYGYKYCVAFGLLLRPKLSHIGQTWIDKTLVLLQQYMEDGLVDKRWYPVKNEEFIDKYGIQEEDKFLEKFYTDIELDSNKFKDFAFATHPDAYLKGGLTNLPIEDLVRVGITPDFAEWKDMSTIDQALIVGKEVVPSLTKRVLNFVKEGVAVTVSKMGELEQSSFKTFY